MCVSFVVGYHVGPLAGPPGLATGRVSGGSVWCGHCVCVVSCLLHCLLSVVVLSVFLCLFGAVICTVSLDRPSCSRGHDRGRDSNRDFGLIVFCGLCGSQWERHYK